MQIQFTLDKGAFKPTKAHYTDAGFDLYAKEDQQIGMNNVIFDTGVHILIPAGFVGLVLPRSSMSAKGVICATGVIDAGYSGSIKICLRCQNWFFNGLQDHLSLDNNHHLSLDNKPLKVHAGERIAQIVIVPLPEIELQEVSELPKTDRGSNGFGSSGK